jgi:hypothetical protein
MNQDNNKTLKFATFGCWNEGCKVGSVQERVTNKLIENKELYNFLVILGDNYYGKKIKTEYTLSDGTKREYKVTDININDMKNGFDCLDKINIKKKIILGNHDIDDGLNEFCNITKIQLNLPWYDNKFPYAVEKYYLFDNDTPTIIKMLYLDTTVYENKNAVSKTCYDRVLNKSVVEIINDQNKFIEDELNNLSTNTIVVIFGHAPLITFRFKKDKIYDNSDLLDILFEHKQKIPLIPFYYICADFHTYENAIINKKGLNNNIKIEQIVLGTGGKKTLDERFEPTKERLIQLDPYIYSVQNVLPHTENGYGEITITKDGLTHEFIGIGNIKKPDKFKNKYLKYKQKYLKLKNIVK